MRSVIICLLLSAVAISANLQSDIEDVVGHLPMKEIESIGKQYVAAYPGYGDGLRFVQIITYEKLVKDFLQSKEGHNLIEYFKQRGMEIEKIWLHMTKMAVDINKKWLEPMNEDDLNAPGITGNIMADYKKAVDASGFFDYVHKKMEASTEFAKLVAAFKDPEFRALFYRVAN